MGLGKTLTTLATILSTLNEAKSWLLSKPPGTLMRQRSKATVIVVPSEGNPEPNRNIGIIMTDFSSSYESMARGDPNVRNSYL